MMKRWLLFFALSLVPAAAMAQGVTSAALSGRVLDDAGEPLPGTNVLAVHEPTGTQYGAATSVDGRYTLVNLRTGGPYTVTVSFIGFQTASETGVNLTLGATFSRRRRCPHAGSSSWASATRSDPRLSPTARRARRKLRRGLLA